jgi:hypothetical protein
MAGNSKTPGRSVISKVSAILLTVAEDSRSTLTEIAARSELPFIHHPSARSGADRVGCAGANDGQSLPRRPTLADDQWDLLVRLG